MSDDPLRLIARYLSKEATPEEQDQLLEWVRERVENQQMFQQYADDWNKANFHARRVDKTSALRALNNKIDAAERWEADRSGYSLWVKIAASFAGILIAATAVFLVTKSDAPKEISVRTIPGQRLTVELSDGSVIQLHGESSLTYPDKFDNNTREVTLQGEAFFEVARDVSKPFIVQTGSLSTEVLGTSFNIDANSEQVAVTVATGRVKVSHANAAEVLLPSDQVNYDTETHRMTRGHADLDVDLAWTKGSIVFRDTDLTTALNRLERHYGVRIQLVQPATTTACKITGTYTNETLDHILNAISFSTGAEIKADSTNTILIKAKSCQ